MSDNGSQIVSPSDLRDASRERLLAEIGLIQHQHSLTDGAQLESQIVQLKNSIDSTKRALVDAEMRLLQARDYAKGCAAELGEARANFALHIADADRKVRQARKKVQSIYATRTWKMGRLIMLPARILRRIIKVG